MFRKPKRPLSNTEREAALAVRQVRRHQRVLNVRQSAGDVLLLLGVANVCAFFWVEFGYLIGILAIGVSLAVAGVLIDLDLEKGRTDGNRGEAGPPR